MEEDLKYLKESPIIVRVKRRLTAAVEKASERQKYESAHNPELIKALKVVEQFLKGKKRVCYGGTAMNAILPPSKQFYNPELDLPDYDFFTPEMEEDIEDLVALLRKSGFTEIYHKVGIHEGTKKILVNFTPIADITYISKPIFNVLLKRSIVRKGVHHTDPEILRMMMYLELSRPKGQVARWEKVYERLKLINTVFPPRKSLGHTRKQTGRVNYAVLPADMKAAVFDYCIEKQRSIFTGNLDSFYKRVIEAKSNTPVFDIRDFKGPLGFITSDVRGDTKAIQELLGGSSIANVLLHPAKGEIVPTYVEISYNGLPAFLLLEETACHSYLSFPVVGGRSISICSLDTLITIYYSLAIFTGTARRYISNIESRINKLVELTERNRLYKNPNIPSFPISCHGYQKGFSTLLREKIGRIAKEKAGGIE
jgi:hypothetical protein